MIVGLHREGTRILWSLLIALIAFNLTAIWFLAPSSYLIAIFFVISLVLFFLVAQFFRVPKRSFVSNENQIICPADGKVVAIEEVDENEYLRTRCRQISVFMSPLNVHIQWYPIDGKVSYSKYHPGKYLVAWHPKSSTENERHTTVVENNRVSILFRQIAGAVARRIISYSEVGQSVKKSDEAGFIKFGSRVDIFIPLEAKVNVQLQQKVKGGVSVLAEY